MCRKYPQFQQQDIFALQDAFRKLDVDDKGYIDEATVIKATQASERQPYDVVRSALKEVELDSSRRVELDDYVDVRHVILALELGRGRKDCYRGAARLTPYVTAHVQSPWWISTNTSPDGQWPGARSQQCSRKTASAFTGTPIEG